MQPFVTGPVRVFLAFPGGVVTTPLAALLSNYGQPVSLGTCEKGVEIHEDIAYEQVMNDLGGTRKSFDETFQGKDCVVAGVLTRHRETTLRRLREMPAYTQLGGMTDFNGELGSLMGLEQLGCILFLVFAYGGGGPLGVPTPSSKPVHVAGGLPSGYRFLNAQWKGGKHSTGTSAKRVQAIWECKRIYSPTLGAMLCNDEDVSATAAVPFEAL